MNAFALFAVMLVLSWGTILESNKWHSDRIIATIKSNGCSTQQIETSYSERRDSYKLEDS